MVVSVWVKHAGAAIYGWFSVDAILRQTSQQRPTKSLKEGLDSLEASMQQLANMLATVTGYVDDVVVSVNCAVPTQLKELCRRESVKVTATLGN